MSVAAALTAGLRDLALEFGLDHLVVDDSLDRLRRELGQAVESYCGLRITVAQDGFPITLTAFEPLADGATVASSLELSLTVLAGAAPSSVLVLYATRPGAFVDLAADLGYVLPDHAGVGGHLRLDAGLPPSGTESGIVGVETWSTVNRAAGVLIGGGEDPSRAHSELRDRAFAARLEPLAYARLLLGRTPVDGHPPPRRDGVDGTVR